MVNTAIVKAAVLFAATLNPELPSSSFNNDNRGFRLPSLPQRRPTSQVTEMPALDVAAASKDPTFAATPLGAYIAVQGGEQVQKQSFLQRHPFWSACGITTVNAFAADLLTQCFFEANPWNPKRSAVFAAFGFLYQGENGGTSGSSPYGFVDRLHSN